jgi:hypothetical protein
MSTQTPVKSLPLAKDLNKEFPRSPRETLGGFVLAARMLDKCRAVINGTNGEYHFNCPLDQKILSFAGLDAEAFKAFVATGADDAAVAEWIQTHTQVKDRGDIVRWNNQLRDLRLSDMPIELQLYMEDYIRENVPAGRIVYHWFDVYDLEEKRI